MACEVDIFLFRTSSPPTRGTIETILDSMDPNMVSVIVDRDVVFNQNHISSAIMHAARSILSGKARAKAPALEVIRWLTGSHQVSRGIETANPGKSTSHILVMNIPECWPNESDGNEFPKLMEKRYDGSVPEGLEIILPPFDLGGDKALEKLGLDTDENTSNLEKEKMILEAVCLPALK
jgi:kinase binding protein CGI-121